MIHSLNQNSSLLEEFILAQFDFRNNLSNKLLGKSSAEYKRKSTDNWTPLSYFLKKERKFILKENDKEDVFNLSNTPDWLVNKVLSKAMKKAERYIPKPELLQIIDEKPTFLRNVKPLSLAKRQTVELKKGEKCYVSLGVKKGFFGKKFSVLPGVVERLNSDGHNDYYNVFLLKYNALADKIEYHGRHMVLKTEVGKTPEQAVQNTAISQLIY